MIFVILFIILFIVLCSIKQVNEYERGVLFTFGKYSRILGPGWHIVWPIANSFKRVDIRTKTVDVPEQEAITKDNVSIKINAVLYYKIFDAAKAVIAVENFNYAVSQLAQTTMRNVVGSVSLDELLTQRDKLSNEICKIVDEATDPWGIKVNRVEVKNIIPPRDIQEAMEKQMRAERERREKILQAEGEKKSSVLIAEGEKESAILRAEAKKESQIRIAEGEAEALLKIKQAEAEGIRLLKEAKADDAVLKLKSFDTLANVANGQATKIIVPSDLQNLATFGTVVKEMIKKD